MVFDIIVALDENGIIGKNNTIPWHHTVDLEYFKKKTKETDFPGQQNIVIMGRKTFDSIGKALVGRTNCIISRNKNIETGTEICSNLEDAIMMYENCSNVCNIFVIGGAQIYNMALKLPNLRYIYVTYVKSNIVVNENEQYTYFPMKQIDFYNKYPLISTSMYNETLAFCKYVNPFFFNQIDDNSFFFNQIDVNRVKPNVEEYQYLNLLRSILTTGHKRQTRNAITLSTFGHQLKFNLSNHFPILTTKRVYWRGVVEELLWFLKGDTNALTLADKKVNIWVPNTTKEFLNDRGLSYNVGDTGPMYGFQWIHYGAEYKGMEHDYDDKGFNQLEQCINMLKQDPHNRRILMTTYNPAQVKESVLAPCHGIVIQFYVEDKNKLSCYMYQRSSDSFLGLPFNISSYSLLVYIIAAEVGLKPGNLYIGLGDTHIYENHIEAVKEQLERTPTEFPRLIFEKKKIQDYVYTDFKLVGYKPHKSIKAEMIP